jgi:4-amino-4-deoxy-L-arabinose transferase-like glycosyltransferase
MMEQSSKNPRKSIDHTAEQGCLPKGPPGRPTHTSRSFFQAFLPYYLVTAGIGLLIRQSFISTGAQDVVFLARSFLDGHLYFTAMPGTWDDTSFFLGHYYWPLGPLPAIILMPFVAIFGMGAQLGYPLLLFNLLNLLLLYKIARKITGNHENSLWLSFAYIFSTAYLFIALYAFSWYFAQAVATSFLLLALYEYYHHRRWWLIGLWIALGAATRITIVLTGVFFILSIIFENDQRSEKIKQFAMFSSPVAVGMMLLLVYNFLRFQNILEFGYTLQVLHNEPAANRGYGLWGFIHFPANLYYLFFKGPDGVFLPDTKVLTYPYLKADIWGMSIFFTSPIFLWALKARWKELAVRLSALTCCLMLFVLLGYYGIGVGQYGYRYALDFYPYLFLLIAYASRPQFSLSMKIVTLASFIFNWYLIAHI